MATKRGRTFGSKKAKLEVPPFLKSKTAGTKSGLVKEVSDALPLLSKVDQATYRKILQSVVQHLKGKEYSSDEFKKIANVLEVDEGEFATMFTATFFILRAAIRTRAHKKEVLKITGMGFSEKIAADVANVIHGNRDALESAAIASSVTIPTMEDLKWRVDVAISTSDLSKCLKPSILMQMKLSDGSLQNFQLPLEKFHELRCNVAKALKSVHELEAHPLIRVIKHVEQNEKQALAKE
eukprot:g739.t1